MRRALDCGDCSGQRRWPRPNGDSSRSNNHACRNRQTKLGLACFNQFQIDFGKQFGVKQRPMLRATRIVDAITGAQIVKTIRATGELASRKKEGVNQAVARQSASASPLEFSVQKPNVERGIVNDQPRITNEAEKLLRNLSEWRLVLEKVR